MYKFFGLLYTLAGVLVLADIAPVNVITNEHIVATIWVVGGTILMKD